MINSVYIAGKGYNYLPFRIKVCILTWKALVKGGQLVPL